MSAWWVGFGADGSVSGSVCRSSAVHIAGGGGDMALGVHDPRGLALDGVAVESDRVHARPLGGDMGAAGHARVLLRGRLHAPSFLPQLHPRDLSPVPQTADGKAAGAGVGTGGGVGHHRLGAGGNRGPGLDLVGGDPGAVAAVVPRGVRGDGPHRSDRHPGPLAVGGDRAGMAAGPRRSAGRAPLHPGSGLGCLGQLSRYLGTCPPTRFLLRPAGGRSSPAPAG